MPINHPYDPHYNAKIYIPKLTEEQRLARVTPLENLRGLRYRTATPAAPSPAEADVPTPVTTPVAPITPPQPEAAVPSPLQIAPAEPSPTEGAAPAPLSAPNTPAPPYIPSAREVVFAEFPELYPERIGLAHGESHMRELCFVGATPTDGDQDGELPRRDQMHDTRTRSFTRTGKVPPAVQDPPQEDTGAGGVKPRSIKGPNSRFRASSMVKGSASPLIQSFRFGSNPGAPPHSPPVSKLRV